MLSRTPWLTLLAELLFSAGTLLLGVTLFPRNSSVGVSFTGLAATFGIAPAWPLHVILKYAYLITIPAYFWWLGLLLLVPFCTGLGRMKNWELKHVLKHIAVCQLVVGGSLFAIFMVAYFRYGTAFALNPPDREAVVMSFVPTGIVGLVLLQQGVLLGYIVTRIGNNVNDKVVE